MAGFVMAASLVLPWFDISGRARSSIDLISSASALEVIDGSMRFVVIGLWMLVPICVAGALLAFAAQRARVAMVLLAVTAVAVLAVLVIAFAVGEISLAWGAWLAAVCAVAALGCAMMVLSQGDGNSADG